MGKLTSRFSPLVFAELYEALARESKYKDNLADLLESINLSYEWLEEAAAAYLSKWQHDLQYISLESLEGFSLEPQHAEFATWLLAGLHFTGAPDELSATLQEAVMDRALTDIPGLTLPLPPELSPVIVAWTLGRVIADDGHSLPISPAILPEDENARTAFTGLVEHFLLLRSLEEPWPEMMCTSLYWRGYGIAEALRPEYDSGGKALKQLQLEARNSMPESLRFSVGRHLDSFGTRRNVLSHVADMEGRPRFIEIVPLARDAGDLELTIKAMSQFVFQEVARQVRDRRPKVVRPQVWEGLGRDLQTEW